MMTQRNDTPDLLARIRQGIAVGTRVAALACGLPAMAQAPVGQTVNWTVPPAIAARPGGHASLVLHGAVREGWHVYAFQQQDNGPTPLRVALEANDVALAAGPAQGSAPRIEHDRAFNLDTPLYTRDFTVTVPVRLKPHAAPGRQSIPVSVRFQTCNGQTCEPPKTLHLSAVVDVAAGH